MPSPKQVLVGVLGLGLSVTGLSLAAAPAQANPAGTGLVISEVYGGGGNSGATWKSDFVELYNPTDAAISVDGWTLQARSATNTSAATAANSVALTGEVPASGHYLIKLADGSGGTQDLPVPDATGTIAMGAAGWQVWLSNGSTLLDPADGNVVGTDPAIIDFVGAATNSASFEGAVANEAPTNTLSAQRDAVGTDTDNNANDFSVAEPTPENDGINPPLEATDPADVEAFVGVAIDPVDLQAVGGTPPYTWAVTTGTLPNGLTLSPDGELSGTPTAEGTANVTFTVTDSATPAATDSVDVTITVEPEPEVRTIAEIQGTDTATSPEVGNVVRTQGVVTAMYKDPAFANSNIDGMYIQTGGTGGPTDATPGASDAIFVFWGSAVAAVDGIEIGDSVEVIGEVSEFQGTTEITVGVGDVTELGSPLPAATALEIAYPTTEAAREAQEGMLLAPTDDFTVSNTFNTNRFGEVGLATGDTPLVQPTDVVDDDDPTGLQTIKDDNFARGVILDDGTSLDYVNNDAAKDSPLPWLTAAGGGPNPIRVGAEATLTGPVILDFEFSAWRFYPQQPLIGNGDAVATFEDTRTANMAPAAVPGDLKLATFNVLNYFNTTGEAYVANGASLTPPTHCTYFTDRDGNRIANNRCGRQNPAGSSQPNDGSGPRGAATDVSLQRQQAKIVTAINGLGADIVTLEELENSIKLPGETNRDDAISAVVDALNADAGAGTWAFVASPAEASRPGRVAEQDTIRNGFIYKPASVEPVGESDLLFGTAAFANAREPLAQAFRPAGAGDEMAFVVVVNHFKSKGDSDPAATGDNANNPDTGAFNGDRTRQAQALVAFANEFAALRGTDKIFLTGDFNSYTHEDPITVLNDAGFDIVESADPEDETYSFGGLSGSLDHVLANDAAMSTVQGADIWEINADESVAFQYSRFNYNVTDFWQPNLPFGASDHNPEIVGFNPAASGDVPTPVQILGTNDFHGRLLADGAQPTQDCDDVTCPAAVLSAAVKELRTENPNTVFSAAGDLIGASTFESFILDDEPTIDALNEAGLEVSAAGNHEFDQGYEDLVGRVQDRAEWEYIAANVDEPTGRDDLAETWTQQFGDIEIGFVGAVTEELPALVSPAGIEGVTVTDIVDSTNAAAADLKAGGADIVVLLVHEGSPSTDCTSPNFTDPNTVWGNISQNTSDDVDAIISGHTHLAYNCTIDGRPVVSSGQYGQNLNQLMYLVDETTGEVALSSQSILPLTEANYGEDPLVVDIVHEAKAQADILGAQVLGEIDAPANRAKLSNGTTENRGGESTLGNLVAEVQQWATEESHGAQIAFMNPGGLRADMAGNVSGDAREVTYRQAAVVQPFANTLVNMDLTGAQIETVLEQQWQRDAGGAVPTRPFLRLGVSEGFTYTYVETPVTVNNVATFEGEVTGMWLDGIAIDPTETYSVTVNSFLASGGDNFRELANGTSKADTGKVDLAAMVDYLDTFASTEPLALNYSQRAVEVRNVAESYVAGEQVEFDVESWSMSTADDVKDTEIQVKLGDTVLGTATLDNTVSDAVYDNTGTASVNVTLPASTPAGPANLTLVGADTGTEVIVPITVEVNAVVNDELPTITGQPKIGKTLTASQGTWTPTPESVSYQWLADGTPIAGATGSTLKLKKGQVGKRISVEVTASVAGLQDGVAESEQTARVTKAPVKVTANVKPSTIEVTETRATVVVKVFNADGVAVTGTVSIDAKGIKKVTKRVRDGKATLRLPVFKTIGKKVLTIKYSGNDSLLAETVKETIRVSR